MNCYTVLVWVFFGLYVYIFVACILFQYVIVSNSHIAADHQSQHEPLPVRLEISSSSDTSGHILLNSSSEVAAMTEHIKFLEISTPFGRCYEMLTFEHIGYKSGDYVSLLFNMSSLGHRKLQVYLYEHGVIGLMGNYWVTLLFCYC